MLALSTSCFGTRLTDFHKIAESTRTLGFERIEIGLTEAPPSWNGLESALQDFGVRAPVLRAGCRETPRGDYRPADHLSSTDEPARQAALRSIAQDIEIAKRSSSGILSLRGGFIAVPGIGDRIKTLVSHMRQGREKETLELREEIHLAVAPHRLKALDRLCRSLHAISRSTPGLRIAVETPPDPHFLPNPQEMEHVIEDLSGAPIFYMHDTGNAAFLEKLDGIPHGSWLETLVPHLLGARLHDMLGLDRHLPPGLGEIDWKLVADYAPRTALGILDLAPQHGADGIRGAARFVEKFGWGG